MRTMSVEVIGSMDAGGGTCLIVREAGQRPIVIDCGANPTAGSRSQYITQRIARAVTRAQPEFIVLTHFHFDHWGALLLVLEEMALRGIPAPAIVSTDTTFKLLQKRLGYPVRHKTSAERISLIPNKHSVPGSAGVLVKGSKTLLYTGDCYGMDGLESLPTVDLLIVDSTGAAREHPRFDREGEIRENIVGLISETLRGDRSAKAYIALFSTQLERASYLREETNRLICLYPEIKGASLYQNLAALGKAWTRGKEIRVVLSTGVWAQGENVRFGEGASALVRISNQEDRECELKAGDLVVLSGSIPTWSPSLTLQIKRMCRRLHNLGGRVVVDVSAPEDWAAFCERREVHAGGHGNMPEIAEIIKGIHPNKVLPFHASSEARVKVARHCARHGINVAPALPLILV